MSTKADQQSTGTNTQKDPKDWVTGDEAMTGAQRSYLHTLAQEAGRNPEDYDHLSKAEASLKIDELRTETGRGMADDGHPVDAAPRADDEAEEADEATANGDTAETIETVQR